LEWWHSWKLGVELSVQSVPYSSTLLFNKKIKISYFSVSLKNKKKKNHSCLPFIGETSFTRRQLVIQFYIKFHLLNKRKSLL